MFCPKCATQNLEGASYCRSCGANISLLPHALSGQWPQAAWPARAQFGSCLQECFYGRRIPDYLDGARVFANGNGLVVLDVDSSVFNDGHRYRPIYSTPGTRKKIVSSRHHRTVLDDA